MSGNSKDIDFRRAFLEGIADQLARSVDSYGRTPGGVSLEEKVGSDLRHGHHEPQEYLKVWLMNCRPFAYATRDDSWGELEKELPIVLRRMLIAEARLRRLEHLLRALFGAPVAGAPLGAEKELGPLLGSIGDVLQTDLASPHAERRDPPVRSRAPSSPADSSWTLDR